MKIYTPEMFVEKYRVTRLKPCDINLPHPVSVKGRKGYKKARAVSLRVSYNLKCGCSVAVFIDVDSHYRQIQWYMLTEEEKKAIQKAIGI